MKLASKQAKQVGGKQAKIMKDGVNAKGEFADEIHFVGEIDSSSWRLRDMAHRMIYHRYGPEGETVAPRQSAENMHMSMQFDLETGVARIRRDRAGVVRSAFDAAATAVLEAVEKTVEQHMKKQRRKSMNLLQQDDLPQFLTQWARLEEMRLISMERALNNKDDYAKRPLPPDVVGKRRGRRPKDATAMDTATTAPALSCEPPETSAPAAATPAATPAAAPAATPAAIKVEKEDNNTITKNNNTNVEKRIASAKKKEKEPPKFTRNTPASSAVALDSRMQNVRAILCTAGNVNFEALTPPLPGLDIENVTDIPQNPTKQGDTSSSAINMGSVVVEAQTLGQRAISVGVNASRRAKQRFEYRKDNILFDPTRQRKDFFRMKSPFAWKNTGDRDPEKDAQTCLEAVAVPYQPNPDAITTTWAEHCLPRFLSILTTGVGNAVYSDTAWPTRHGRFASLFQVLAQEKGNYGTHLIITTEPDISLFAQEFQPFNQHQTLLKTINTESLRALAYLGDREQRRKLRFFFPKATGLVDSPFHVLVTSYKSFLEDYLHFCQFPFETVVVDDGASWMAAANSDQNSPLGTIWEQAIWSSKDHAGLAGTTFEKWDYLSDHIPVPVQQEAWIGLTARNRILTASVVEASMKNSLDRLPVSGLVGFVAPHFANAVREEWDRSRIHADADSMNHFRKLLTRSIIVHFPGEDQDLCTLAMKALNGGLPPADRSQDPPAPAFIPDEKFVSDGKVASSRRGALAWLGPPERSWLRYELGSVSFSKILDILSRSSHFGNFCEEIVVSSLTTATGSAGQVAGSLAYRLAQRCNRHFGTEQNLRQHLAAFHAPPGTWLCRTCGTDCITSQSRTHHERSCGQATSGGDPNGSNSGPNRSLSTGPTGVVGKKKGKAKASQGGSAPEDKDPDGSFRVRGYRGVWVNPQGRHFVKVNGKRLTVTQMPDVLFFDSIEEAAKAHDNALKEQGNDAKAELNYQEDGARIIYEDTTTSSTAGAGLGGSASNVVPALSVINIKDLPEDVKPLLRDPRQTSRTGGNSKRHVYAYRGVCRQARKGHDRWQSQISFMGVNHYLGTFDSEWDAAAIYAWAHLILYGEEATKKAQKEGEEAAAAYEQEKKDIAAGKIVVPPPRKPEKKQKKAAKKGKDKKKESSTASTKEKSGEAPNGGAGKTLSKKRKKSSDGARPPGEGRRKKMKPGPKTAQKLDDKGKGGLAPVLSKGVARAWALAPRDTFLQKTDAELMESAVPRIIAARDMNYRVADKLRPAAMDDMVRPCLAESLDQSGAAMLVGLSSSLFGWDVDMFVSSRVFDSPEQERDATSALKCEFGEEGVNEIFRTLIQGPLCVIGNASPRTRKAHKQLGLGKIPVGSAVGEIDCHIGGTLLSCSEAAASIRFAPTTAGDFQFSCLSDDDIVTLNGKRITPGMGSYPVWTEDVLTVGARVFIFILPNDR